MCIAISRILLIAVLLLLPLNLSFANDSTARIGAGGMTLLKNENIRMIQEVLEISTQKIRVRYRFINESDQDIKTTVAFPLPDYEWNPVTVEFKELIAANKFSSFKNWANGKPVATKRTRKAHISGTDVTNQLRKIGLTDKQVFETFGDGISGDKELTDKQAKAVLDLYRQITGKTSKTAHIWKVSETIHWELSFPKGKEIEVVHEYKPNTGLAPNYLSSTKQKEFSNPIPKAITASGQAKDPNEACLDAAAVRTVQRKINAVLKKSPDSTVGIQLQDVEYILGTGRNWKGPTGNFTLKIIKDSPDQVVSLCFPGKAKQINSKSIEFSQENYTPQDKLTVYFVSVASSN